MKRTQLWINIVGLLFFFILYHIVTHTHTHTVVCDANGSSGVIKGGHCCSLINKLFFVVVHGKLGLAYS